MGSQNILDTATDTQILFSYWPWRCAPIKKSRKSDSIYDSCNNLRSSLVRNRLNRALIRRLRVQIMLGSPNAEIVRVHSRRTSSMAVLNTDTFPTMMQNMMQWTNQWGMMKSKPSNDSNQQEGLRAFIWPRTGMGGGVMDHEPFPVKYHQLGTPELWN